MQAPNLFKFSIDDFCTKELRCAIKPQSLALGRRVFYFFEDQQQYWLKTHTLQMNGALEAAFQYELDFYLALTQEQAQKITLPFQVLNHSKLIDDFQLAMPLLILPHAKSLFAESPYTLTTEQIKHKMIQALSVLENLHEAGWVHADLKKEHFVEYAKTIKLIDFEQSIKMKDIAKNTTLTATPRYMAPELFHAEVKSIASDIYALGIIFYEWLKQERFLARSYYDWAILHCQKLEIELPDRYLCFKTILKAMLNKQKQHRLTDISALKKYLIIENV